MRTLLLLAVLFMWPGCPAAFADLVPDDVDSAEHEIYFEGMDRFPDFTFVLYPTNFSSPNEWVELRPGVSPGWFRHASPQIFAFKRGSGQPVNRSSFDQPEIPFSEMAIFRSNWVPKGSGIARKQTVYRIIGVEGTEIRIEPGMEEQFDASGKLLQSVPAPVIKGSRPKAGPEVSLVKRATLAPEKVPFEVSPGTYWAMAGVSVLGLLILFKLRRSAAARDSKGS